MAVEDVERLIQLDRDLFGLGEGETLFSLRVTGDSMRDAGILEGDLVIVKRGTEPRPGQVVVARLGEEATVKRFASRETGDPLQRPVLEIEYYVDD